MDTQVNNLLIDASNEIKQLRRTNEVLHAKLERGKGLAVALPIGEQNDGDIRALVAEEVDELAALFVPEGILHERDIDGILAQGRERFHGIARRVHAKIDISLEKIADEADILHGAICDEHAQSFAAGGRLRAAIK